MLFFIRYDSVIIAAESEEFRLFMRIISAHDGTIITYLMLVFNFGVLALDHIVLHETCTKNCCHYWIVLHKKIPLFLLVENLVPKQIDYNVNTSYNYFIYYFTQLSRKLMRPAIALIPVTTLSDLCHNN